MKEALASLLESERNKLLQSSLRFNPFLNLRLTKEEIVILDGSPQKIFEDLVVKRNSVLLLPVSDTERTSEQSSDGPPSIDKQSSIEKEDTNLNSLSELSSIVNYSINIDSVDIQEIPEDNDDEQEEQKEEPNLWEKLIRIFSRGAKKFHYHEEQLQTIHSSEDLEARRFNLGQKASSFTRDHGINPIFLALGMLSWYDNANDRKRYAPLILIPIEFKADDPYNHYIYYLEEEGFDLNLALQKRLAEEKGIKLPALQANENSVDLDRYFKEVDKTIHPLSDYSLISDMAVLSFFSFQKFPMYKDLSVAQWPEQIDKEKNQVIRALLRDGFNHSLTEQPKNEPIRQNSSRKRCACGKQAVKSAMEIERELGITHGLLNKWKRQLKNEGQAAFPGRGHLTAEQEQIRQLERKLAIAEQERGHRARGLA